MNEDVEKRFREAEEFIRETTALIASGLYKDSIGHAYYAMFHAATGALQFNKIERKTRQSIHSTFEDTFVKTGRLDKKIANYLREAASAKTDTGVTSFETSDHRQAQATLVKAKEFVAECRKLCQ